jgi:hypothetical protein
MVEASRKYDRFIQFSRLCRDLNRDGLIVAQLMTLADKAFKAGERECNVPNASAEKQRAALEVFVKDNLRGYKVKWPGLWPMLSRGKFDIHLPTI